MNLGQKFASSLFDGEYLEFDKLDENKYLNKMILFDCYVALGGRIMVDNNFGDDKSTEATRYYLQECYNLIIIVKLMIYV